MLTLQETLSIQDSMNSKNIEFITYIYILISISNIKNLYIIYETKQFVKCNHINFYFGV